MKVVRKIIFIICVVTFCVSAFMLAKYFYTGYVVQKDFAALEEYNLQELHEQNSDTFGWIKIPGTKISYPVMYTPNEPEYYLRKNFEKKYSAAGTPFIAYTDVESSQLTTIYGHHMKDGTMFNNLLEYDDETFAKEHSLVMFDTLSFGDKKYRVFAYGKTEADKEGFNVYDYANITTEKRYEEFVKGVKAMTPRDTGITPKYGEKLIMLSTCSYHTEEGRYVVVAVEIK